MTTPLYNADEIIRNFAAIYHSLVIADELKELNVGKLNIWRHKKACREFQAVAIALWYLALEKCFSQEEADSFFSLFCASEAEIGEITDSKNKLRGKIDAYIRLLDEKKDTDFIPIAEYMAETLGATSDDKARLVRRFSLWVRSHYSHIFARLV